MADGNLFSMWRERRRLQLIMQTENVECALACLAMVAGYHGHEIDLASLRRRFSTSLKGVHLGRVIDIASSLGIETRPFRIELEQLREVQMPCILHWDLNHFVVLNEASRRGIDIYDPARGRRFLTWSEASRHFTGIALELSPGDDFKRGDERQRISLRAIAGRFVGVKRVILQVLGLALAIEVLALLIPFQMQWVLDHVLLSADRNLLLLITLGFLAVIGLSTALSLARAWVISWFAAEINVQWVTNLFSHLLSLPMDYFEKRRMSDVLSRFSSVGSIQRTITGGFVEAVLDGLMGFLALIILFIYSTELTILVMAAFCLYAALRWLMYRTLWRLNEEQLVYGVKQQGELMDAMRGIQTIKLANKQNERKARLVNATLEASMRTMRSERITLAFGVINQSLFGVQRIGLIALGAHLVIQGVSSAGMLVAYVAYADQFATKVGRLVDRVVEFRMLRLHTERIADIALAPPEKNIQGMHSGPEPAPRILVKDLSFRYAQDEPWVLRHLALEINVGESVAIIGPSGYGKSTLAKLLVGLLEPTEGVIEIDGLDIRRYGLENFRRHIGAVMQDDTLLAGSIADNISMFDQAAAMEDIVAAATTADIHKDVAAMPMAYESMVGDMGTALSGGQRQRLMLARAIYRKPRILVLDEATSHLDVKRERSINLAISNMRVTRILFAHRPETIASADRIIDLESTNSI
jgi:ATP-binding cassette subfamily B protein RaxB